MALEECLKCSVSRDNVEFWMEHLADCHPIPTEWPSEKLDRLTGPGLLKPYTTITESKKKRKKDVIPRPLNSFMIFAQHMRRNILLIFTEASNSDISKQLGRIWQSISAQVKAQYNAEANRLTKIHLKEFPNYKYQPKKKLKPGQQPPPSHQQPSGLHLQQQQQIQQQHQQQQNFHHVQQFQHHHLNNNNNKGNSSLNQLSYGDHHHLYSAPQIMPLTVKTSIDSGSINDQLVDTKWVSNYSQYSFSPDNVSNYLPLSGLPTLMSATDVISSVASATTPSPMTGGYQLSSSSYNQLISGGLPCSVSPLQPTSQSPSMPALTHATNNTRLVSSSNNNNHSSSSLLASVYSLASDYQSGMSGPPNFVEPLITNFNDSPSSPSDGQGSNIYGNIDLNKLREATNIVLSRGERGDSLGNGGNNSFLLDVPNLLPIKEELGAGGGGGLNNNLVQTPSSIQSDDLLSMVPTSVLNDESSYEEQFGSIFPDQLPNLNSWVTSGNFI